MSSISFKYWYDGFNQLSRVQNSDGQFIDYTYNGQGLRTKKDFGDKSIKYYYNNANIILETDQDNAVTAKNIRGLHLIYRESYANSSTDPDFLYYLHNAHGDVTQLLNEKGQVVKDYRYDPFGQEEMPESKVFGGKQAGELWRQEVEKIDNPFRYCGEYLDDETGNYYLRARYYDPNIQRFINEDSYAVAFGAAWREHLYSYAENNPINKIDPSGHITLKIGSKGSEVKQLQKALGIKADGIFGPKTQAAVNDFKNKNQLGNTGQYAGVVGDQTWKALGLPEKSSNNSNTNSSKSKLSTEYPVEDPNKYLVFSNPNQKNIDPILAGRLAAFAKNHNIKIYISSGYRSYDEQVKLYKQSGGYQDKKGNWVGGNGIVAKPGSSWHNYGEAIDINNNGTSSSKYIKSLHKNDKTDLQTELLKYGLFKPLTKGNGISVCEDWHIQPIETATDKDKESFYRAYSG